MVNDDSIRVKLEEKFAVLFSDLYTEDEVQVEEDEMVYLSDGNNGELEYEVMDRIEFGDQLYWILLPNDSCEDEGVVRIKRFVDLEEKGFELVDVYDKYILRNVYNIFKERFEDLLNFED